MSSPKGESVEERSSPKGRWVGGGSSPKGGLSPIVTRLFEDRFKRMMLTKDGSDKDKASDVREQLCMSASSACVRTKSESEEQLRLNDWNLVV